MSDVRKTLADAPAPDAETARKMNAILYGGYQGKIEAYAARVVAEAPPLTSEQRERLAGLLSGERHVAPASRPAPPPPPPRPCFLYHHFDEFGELLYVGISFDALTRARAHMRHSAWAQFAMDVWVTEFPDKGSARDAEQEAIQTEEPTFNVVHSMRTEAERQAALISYMHRRNRRTGGAS